MTILFLLGIGALYFGANVYGHRSADRSFDRLLVGSALSIMEATSTSDQGIDVDLPYPALDMLASAPDDRVFYRVIGPAGATVTGYGDLPSPPSPLIAQKRPSGEPRYFDHWYRGEMVRFVSIGREVAFRGAKRWIWVQVGQTRNARENFARETILSTLLPIAAITVLALAGIWFGIARALKPLDSIEAQLANREPSDLRPIVAAVPRDLLPMVDGINGFMVRLDVSVRTLRAFIADASHQLRTPLSALLAHAYVRDDDPVEMRNSLRAIERNGRRLSHLFNQLLSDATISHRADLRIFEDIDLVSVVQDAVRDVVEVSEESDIRFHTSFEHAPYSGDAVLLREALKNLLHNALVHGASEEQPIDVDLSSLPQGYRIAVMDRGAGIDLPTRTHLFERFAPSRSGRGAGLGLAIVQQAVEAHSGQVTLTDRDGGGTCAIILLPERSS